MKLDIPKTDVNLVDAAARGTSEGLHLMLNVIAMLISFIALIALVNGLFGFIHGHVGWFPADIQTVLGWVCRPVAWATHPVGAVRQVAQPFDQPARTAHVIWTRCGAQGLEGGQALTGVGVVVAEQHGEVGQHACTSARSRPDGGQRGAQQALGPRCDEGQVGPGRGEGGAGVVDDLDRHDGAALWGPWRDRRAPHAEGGALEVHVVEALAVDVAAGRDVPDDGVVLPAVAQPPDHVGHLGRLAYSSCLGATGRRRRGGPRSRCPTRSPPSQTGPA